MWQTSKRAPKAKRDSVAGLSPGQVSVPRQFISPTFMASGPEDLPGGKIKVGVYMSELQFLSQPADCPPFRIKLTQKESASTVFENLFSLPGDLIFSPDMIWLPCWIVSAFHLLGVVHQVPGRCRRLPADLGRPAPVHIFQLQSHKTGLQLCGNYPGFKKHLVLFFKHFSFDTYPSTTHFPP